MDAPSLGENGDPDADSSTADGVDGTDAGDRGDRACTAGIADGSGRVWEDCAEGDLDASPGMPSSRCTSRVVEAGRGCGVSNSFAVDVNTLTAKRAITA